MVVQEEGEKGKCQRKVREVVNGSGRLSEVSACPCALCLPGSVTALETSRPGRTGRGAVSSGYTSTSVRTAGMAGQEGGFGGFRTSFLRHGTSSPVGSSIATEPTTSHCACSHRNVNAAIPLLWQCVFQQSEVQSSKTQCMSF